MLTLKSRNVRRSTDGWRLTGYTMLAPTCIGTRKPGDCSKMCDRGRTDSIRSLGPMGKTLGSSWALDARLRWVSIAPFGSPVVPLVNRTSTRSSGPMSAGAIGSARRARSGMRSMRMIGSPRDEAAAAVCW